jgi:hypothetical protein
MTKGGIPTINSATLKLESSNIFFDRKRSLPADLEALLTKLQTPRLEEGISPNAHSSAVEQSESDAINTLHRHLANPIWGPLERARLDFSTGYVLHRQAQPMDLTAPFTDEEDRVLRQFAVAPTMHFPF